MSDNGGCSEFDCCKIPVCLEFICVEATDEFKEQMKELFSEIFSDLCGSSAECCPDQIGEKIDMCLNGNTINVSRNACKGILQAGGTCGPCEEPTD